MCNNLLNYEEKIISEYNRTQSLINKELEEISNLQFKIQCMKEHSAELIKKIPVEVNFSVYKDLWYDFNEGENKFNRDTTKTKEDKFREKIFIREKFFSKNMCPKLKRIILLGYDDKGIEFEYSVKDKLGSNKVITITIPNFQIANKDNYDNLYYQACIKTGDSSYDVFSRTLEVNKLIEDINTILGYKNLCRIT